jgi:hypothetical protein
MRTKYRHCNTCEGVKKVTPELTCSECGDSLVSGISRNVPDVLGFRPHYNASTGRYETSQAGMIEYGKQRGFEMRQW